MTKSTQEEYQQELIEDFKSLLNERGLKLFEKKHINISWIYYMRETIAYIFFGPSKKGLDEVKDTMFPNYIKHADLNLMPRLFEVNEVEVSTATRTKEEYEILGRWLEGQIQDQKAPPIVEETVNWVLAHPNGEGDSVDPGVYRITARIVSSVSVGSQE